MKKHAKKTPLLPSKADILAFIGKKPGKVGTREIARAFGLKNALRADLKRLLRELADEGSIEKRRKKLHHAGALPSTVLADVTAATATAISLPHRTNGTRKHMAQHRKSAFMCRARHARERPPA